MKNYSVYGEENNEDYHNLLKLVSESWISGFWQYPRLETETKVIRNLGYADTFLILWDAVRWAKADGRDFS